MPNTSNLLKVNGIIQVEIIGDFILEVVFIVLLCYAILHKKL